jgi:hypothetical protein
MPTMDDYQVQSTTDNQVATGKKQKAKDYEAKQR